MTIPVSGLNVTTSYTPGKDVTPIESSTTESVPIHKFETTPAVVGIEQGMTINLGKYESAKITVSISLPCYKEEVEATYLKAQEFVETRLGKEIQSLKELSVNRKYGGI